VGAGKQSATFVGPAAKSESALHFTNRLSKPRVGFHAINFDYEVVVGYTVQDLPHLCHTLDLLVGIGKPPGHRLGLDAVASASPGVGKRATVSMPSAGGAKASCWRSRNTAAST